MLALSWAVLGVSMALGLYDVAFATLARLYGRDARGAITGITLLAGFASTIGWPLSAFMDGIVYPPSVILEPSSRTRRWGGNGCDP